MRALLICLISSAAFAGGGAVEGTVSVKIDGKPGFVKNALVFIKGYSTDAPKESPVMGQSGRQFEHVVLPVVKQSRVTFTNNELDPTLYHHVFSTERGLKLNSKKYKPGASFVTEKLSSVGPIPVFCDIHKQMIATVYVVPNDRYTVLTTAEGDKAPFKIEGIRPGKWTVVAWHRSSGKLTEQPIEIVEGKTAKLDLVIAGEGGTEAKVIAHENKDMTRYRPLHPDGGTPGEHTEGWE